jgi:hypothetical protein
VKNLATAVIATVLLLAVREVAARIAYTPAKPRKGVTYISTDSTLPFLTTFEEIGQHDQRGIYKGVLYETNHLGLRSPERPAQKPEGTIRIALLGDSYVMGDGVLAEDTYAWRLEDELPRVRPGR